VLPTLHNIYVEQKQIVGFNKFLLQSIFLFDTDINVPYNRNNIENSSKRLISFHILHPVFEKVKFLRQGLSDEIFLFLIIFANINFRDPVMTKNFEHLFSRFQIKLMIAKIKDLNNVSSGLENSPFLTFGWKILSFQTIPAGKAGILYHNQAKF